MVNGDYMISARVPFSGQSGAKAQALQAAADFCGKRTVQLVSDNSQEAHCTAAAAKLRSSSGARRDCLPARPGNTEPCGSFGFASLEIVRGRARRVALVR